MIGQAEKKDAINSRVIPKTVKNKHTRHRLKEKRMVRPCRLRILSSCHLCFKEMEEKRNGRKLLGLRMVKKLHIGYLTTDISACKSIGTQTATE